MLHYFYFSFNRYHLACQFFMSFCVILHETESTAFWA